MSRSQRHRFVRFAGLLLAVALGWRPAAAQTTWRYTGVHLLDFSAADPALFMPTMVSVAPDGTVAVADGVHDRVVLFDPHGSQHAVIHEIGAATLLNPVSVRFDANGNLWIADTGHQQALLRAPDGRLLRELPIPPSASGAPADITDLAPTPAGDQLWLVNNNQHHLLRADLAGGTFTTVGEFGESLGQFHYPFALALAPGDGLYVTDVINGRAQALTRDGKPTGNIGVYGVQVGNFYRPKGIALDAAGNVWISDGTLRVIQVFTADGRLIDVLRDAAGKPLKFALPLGLAFDTAGDLYVVELEAHRVRKLRLDLAPQAPPAAPPRPLVGAAAGPQAHACTVCHLEWMNPLQQGQSTELLAPPPNPPEHPHVSRSETCLGCHDATVGDSRRRVWVEHGHKVGIVPPPEVTVPRELPLADGQIACRTCHTAHARAGPGASLEDIVFLRVQGDPAQLCIGCHAAYTAGVDAGTHPLGPLPEPVSGAALPRVNPDHPAITCLVCHSGHGSRYDTLLALNPFNNEVCLGCHQAVAPALFSDAVRSKHGRLPELNPAQQSVAASFETTTSPAGQLLCITCHAVHHATTPRNLLAFDPARDTCAECHVAQHTVLGSAHDLRNSHPDAENILGTTTTAGGACSACHTAHRYARVPAPTPLDPAGRCMTCHTPDGLAHDTHLTDVNHPETGCTECHNPHTPFEGSFLTAPPADLCARCHANYATVLAGPHNVALAPEAWPPVAEEARDACLACHRPHGTPETGLFRAGLAEGAPTAADAACMACHPAAIPGTDGNLAMLHPSSAAGAPPGQPLPLTAAHTGAAQIGCRTCHDPHQGPTHALLRIPPGAPTETLCLTCHVERNNIHMIGHAEAPVQAAGFQVGGCQPCHVTHAQPENVEPDFMWPRSMSDYPGAYTTVAPADHYCLACHRAGGPVAPPAIATHPDVPMFNPDDPNAPGYFPLFDDRGEENARGKIACQTCHLTHGRSRPATVPPELNASGRELRARQWHIRTFAATNVCTTCHGFDALRRFIYFHDPLRRGGPIQQPAAPP